ncbi:isoprenylcysteine carboxylmethyltransferase family protein [Fodinisporobacter ferrooxydans]|uniref:Isoprenylcysteine carboxylmethyltransferase family protein n=1 Tax=Fodinisporobacter ferrooxydans TaxID=2901836 RepID=A0ABY4CS80_9BACL|nr:isoprenylcysteine carboxylmethyltransferase family protein [Alicyclobacillaceae bacterium MYW30-H2]
MHGVNQYEYGLWTAVLFNIVIFTVFAYTAFKPQTKRDWRTLGVFTAFLVALFSEMFGFPLTIYILTSILGKRYPVLDPFSHANGHLWVALAGGSPIVFNILHPLSNLLILSGLIIISIGWRRIHSGNGQFVTSGIYRFMRHPQYSGFALMIVGFLVQWPTIITLLMAPMLLVMYTKLAKKEEKVMIDTFGDEYIQYMKKVPRFVPKMRSPRIRQEV